MVSSADLPALVEEPITARRPFLWLNDAWRSLRDRTPPGEPGWKDLQEAAARLGRFAPLLANLFPELVPSAGIIESPLLFADRFQSAKEPRGTPGRWLIKADHRLPVAGSIKARGGVYEVLVHAEQLAQKEGLLEPGSDPLVLLSPQARTLFGQHQIEVGSTGNLGLSIGIVSVALGFKAVVHMSSDAKEWKKARLRARGVKVVEYQGDFGAAVSAGREHARQDPSAYFVDDEDSAHLFLGYGVAALRLKRQLAELSIWPDERHPLFVYLPCGVGGAPGGITFGLRHALGDHVHCFLAEPVAYPCVLVRLASMTDAPISVRDVGLHSRTEADGLAVGRASEFAVRAVRSLVSGVFTAPDDDLFEDLFILERSEGMRIEPSAAAGFRGPRWLSRSDTGREYLERHGLLDSLADATHILWTTGGSFVPESEYLQFHRRGAAINRSHHFVSRNVAMHFEQA
jgi:D-serine dehydratase